MEFFWLVLQATPLLDKYIFSTFKSAFGGRVRFIVSGGAPLSTHVEEYLTTVLCTPVFQVRPCNIASNQSWNLSHPERAFLLLKPHKERRSSALSYFKYQ